MSVLVKTLLLALLLQPVAGKAYFDHGDWIKAAEKGGTGVDTFDYLLERFDMDGDKALSLDEVFTSAMHPEEADHAHKVTHAVYINAFRNADVNGDNFINGPEFGRMLAEVKKNHDKHQEGVAIDKEKEENDHEEEYPAHGTGMVRGRWLDIARSSGKAGGGATGAMKKYDLDKDKRLSEAEVFGDSAAEHKKDTDKEDYQVTAVVAHEAFKVADKDNNRHLTDGELVDFLRQVIWFESAYQKHARDPLASGHPLAKAEKAPQVVPDKMARGKWLDIANSQGQAGGGAKAALDQFDADNNKRLTKKEILEGPIKSKDAATVGQVQEHIVKAAFKAADHTGHGLDRSEIGTFLSNIVWLSHVHDHHGSIVESDAFAHKPTVHIRGKWMTFAGGLGKPGEGSIAVMEQMDHNNDGKLNWEEVIGEPKKKKDWADEEQVRVEVLARAFKVADENADHMIDGAEVHSFLKHIISYNNFAHSNKMNAKDEL